MLTIHVPSGLRKLFTLFILIIWTSYIAVFFCLIVQNRAKRIIINDDFILNFLVHIYVIAPDDLGKNLADSHIGTYNDLKHSDNTIFVDKIISGTKKG